MMSLLRRPPLRMVLVGLLALTIQTTFCATHRVNNVTPNLMLALAISSGIVAGPEAGAFAGFFFGLAYDLTLATPLGLSALAFAICAYVVAIIKDSITVDQAWWLTMLLGFGGSAAGIWSYAIAGTMVGKHGWIQRGVIKQSIVVGIINMVLALVLAKVQTWTLCAQRDTFKPTVQPL